MAVTDKIFILKSISQEIKIGVIVTDILLTVYVLWLIITNTSTALVGEIFGYTPFGLYLLLRANKLFGLCLLHKLMLVHSGAVYLCCVVQSELGFGNMLDLFRWLMFLWGLMLIVMLSIKRC